MCMRLHEDPLLQILSGTMKYAGKTCHKLNCIYFHFRSCMRACFLQDKLYFLVAAILFTCRVLESWKTQLPDSGLKGQKGDSREGDFCVRGEAQQGDPPCAAGTKDKFSSSHLVVPRQKKKKEKSSIQRRVTCELLE
ncbi:hypothetical protein GDO81_004669 [Engystomops pustulosus]|uniref:Uncharacterized protein n=1 Tax=Engystomops pustulosus TaxID=76066 RepID=A0AAV7CJZ5_ENGPU|nr:hypothetical protein GDO81_004669 [Engystomops pustulosus]